MLLLHRALALLLALHLALTVGLAPAAARTSYDPSGPGRMRQSEPAASVARLPAFLTGVNLAGAEFSPTVIPGTIGANGDYSFPAADEIAYFASKGMNHIRVPVLGQRLQPTLNGSFDTTYAAALAATVTAITGRGLVAVIDLHDYGQVNGVLIADAGTRAAFADRWTRLANLYKANPLVVFGLMNEPHDMGGANVPGAAIWLQAANAAIAAIRATGASNLILVPGTDYTGARTWLTNNAAVMTGVVDPGANYAIEVHQYFDATSGGSADTVVAGSGITALVNVTDWARANGIKLYLGEFGTAPGDQNRVEIENALAHMDAARDVWLGWAWWAAGPRWGSYSYAIEPAGLGTATVVDRPQMAWLAPYLGSAKRVYAVANNRLPSGMSADMTGGRSAIVLQPFYIGSGDVDGLIAAFPNWSPGGEPASDFTIDGAIVSKDGSTVTAPLTFEGVAPTVASPRTVKAGTHYARSDLLPSTALGSAKLNRGDLYWLKFRVTTASTSAKLPRVISLRNSADGGEYRFDPSVTTPALDASNPSGGSGLTAAPSNQRYGAAMLGTFAGTFDPPWAGIGDSIMAAYTENDLSDAPKAVFGWFDRAAAAFARGPLASTNMGLPSETAASSLLVNPRDAFLKFHKAGAEEYGTNDIGAGSIVVKQSALQANAKAIWKKARAQGVGFLARSLLLPRTSSTDGWVTEANQTPNADWVAGGNADLLNGFFASQRGVYGAIDVVIDTSVVKGTSAQKWKAGIALTSDGTHLNSPGNRLVAGAFLASLDAAPSAQVAPAMPTIGAITALATSLTVPFTAPGALATQVRLVDNGVVVRDWAKSASPAAFAGLTTGRTYTVQVRGFNPLGFGGVASATAAPMGAPSWVPVLDGQAAQMAVDFRSGSRRFYGGTSLTDFVADPGAGGVQTSALGLVTNERNVSPASALAAILSTGGPWTVMVEMSGFPTTANSQRILGQYGILLNTFDGSGRPRFIAYNAAASLSAGSTSLLGNVQQRIVVTHGATDIALSAGGQATTVKDISASPSVSISKIGSADGASAFIGNEIVAIAVWPVRGSDAGLATASAGTTPTN